jgi:hypothetical protein
MSAVFYLMIPKSHMSNTVRILKDPFDHLNTSSHFSEEFSADNPQDPQVKKKMRILKDAFHHFGIFSTFMSAVFKSDDAQQPQAQQSEDPQGSFSGLQNFFLQFFQRGIHLTILMSPKSIEVNILKDPFQHFDSFSTFMRAVVI